jgi:serine phosphatase RsbU (regulator of sigma subunit)
MTSRRFFLLLILAIAGYATFGYLFSRVHPAARMDQGIDRSRAIEIAEAEAQRQTFDISNAFTHVETSFQRDSDYYLRRDANPKIGAYLSPTITVVTFLRKASNSLKVTIANDGRIIGWDREEPKPQQPISQTAEDSQRKADEAFAQIIGSGQSLFTKDEAVADSGPARYTWKLAAPEDPRVKLEASVDIENGNATHVKLNPVFSAEYLEAIRTERRFLNAVNITWPILIFIGVLLSVIYYVRNIVRKEVSHRSTLTLALGFFVVTAIWNLAGGIVDDIYSGLYSAPRLQGTLGILLALALVTLLTLVFVLPVFLIWGAAFPFASQQQVNPLRGVEIILRRHVLARITGRNLFIGLTFGWVIPLMTLGIAYVWGAKGVLRSPDQLAGFLTARAPLLTPPTEFAIMAFYLFIIIYALLLPLASAYLRRHALVRLIAILIGAFSLLGTIGYQSSVTASVLVALGLIVLLDQLTMRVDILAAITAIAAGDCVIRLATLVAQPSPALHNSGLRGWTVFAGFGAVVGYIAVRGRELSATELHPVWASGEEQVNRVDRDRLKAEFDVARRAQQQMLPAASPRVPGFEIASLCRPAREVGGDLYDFIPFEGDRLGIVVADVSGKGVPASLYMTLTKGLLVSTAEGTSDPGEILREVNRHLYVACGKKMFVTLLLGIIDTTRRTFSYARAGHNPPVWRRASEDETHLLRARGLGLGLNAGEVFNRALTVETIQLGPRDKLVLYSDGITEAMNIDRAEYGEERLMALTAHSDTLNAEELRDAILQDVSEFLGSVSPQDDQTLVVVQVS